MHAGNTMRLILTTGWSPASSNDDGMNASQRRRDSRLPRVWNHPDASIEIRKRILRAVLMEIVVTIEGDRLCLIVHWQGGDHT
jgi:hypothetical protein